jgi:hypothetical protein
MHTQFWFKHLCFLFRYRHTSQGAIAPTSCLSAMAPKRPPAQARGMTDTAVFYRHVLILLHDMACSFNSLTRCSEVHVFLDALVLDGVCDGIPIGIAGHRHSRIWWTDKPVLARKIMTEFWMRTVWVGGVPGISRGLPLSFFPHNRPYDKKWAEIRANLESVDDVRSPLQVERDTLLEYSGADFNYTGIVVTQNETYSVSDFKWRLCVYCDADGARSKCANCKTRYCHELCQRLHWKVHAPFCKGYNGRF